MRGRGKQVNTNNDNKIAGTQVPFSALPLPVGGRVPASASRSLETRPGSGEGQVGGEGVPPDVARGQAGYLPPGRNGVRTSAN